MVQYSLLWYNWMKKCSNIFLNLYMVILVTFSILGYKMEILKILHLLKINLYIPKMEILRGRSHIMR